MQEISESTNVVHYKDFFLFPGRSGTHINITNFLKISAVHISDQKIISPTILFFFSWGGMHMRLIII